MGLALGYTLDAALGDPQRGHPVAGFGALAHRAQPALPSTRAAGVRHAVGLIAATAILGRAMQQGDPSRSGWVSTALCTWVVLGGRSLDREAAAMHRLLAAGDLPGARQRVKHLVGRDPSNLDAAELTRATIESIAENTSDAVIAPLVWGTLAGPAGLLGYRACNTLDAMVGHTKPKYREFGWASARIDDAANYLPARLAAAATVAAAVPRRRAADAWRAWQQDAPAHPSPNAGPVEAAFAGALGVRLGGTNTYADQTEVRGFLGRGRAPEIADIQRTRRIAWEVSLLCVTGLVVALKSRGAR